MYLLSTSTELSALLTLRHFALTISLLGKFCYNPHFTDGGPEA